MNCPKCAGVTRVYGTQKGLTNIRFRKCTSCNFKFLTQELVKEDLFSKEHNDYLQEIGEIDKELRNRALKDS